MNKKPNPSSAGVQTPHRGFCPNSSAGLRSRIETEQGLGAAACSRATNPTGEWVPCLGPLGSLPVQPVQGHQAGGTLCKLPALEDACAEELACLPRGSAFSTPIPVISYWAKDRTRFGVLALGIF